MDRRESESLDRYITGNYGEDQLHGDEDEIVEPSPAPWVVNPDYGKENAYRLWNKDSNYHDDTSPEAMDANCRLMQAAPELLAACKIAAGRLNDETNHNALTKIRRAISKAEGL